MAANEWQPIETAPYGERVQLRGPGWQGLGKIYEGSLLLEEVEVRGPMGSCGRNDVTHWRDT